MSLRYRRSIKIAPGIKINLTKTGLGMTVGPRGNHYSVHSSGRHTRTVGLPGTGLYYQSVTGRGGQAQGSTGPRGAAPGRPRTVAEAIPRPGIFASHAEKAYHAGVLAQVAGDASAALARFEEVLAADPTIGSAQVLAGFAANALGDGARAIAHLETVVQGTNALPDKYEQKYLSAAGVELTLGVGITHSVMAHPPLSVLAAALALAELYQVTGRLSEAIGIVQQIHSSVPDPVVRLSLCDLLFADYDYEGVVEASVGVVNGSDVELETVHLRAAAFDALGNGTAAMDAFRVALAKTAGRSPALLTAVRYDRALAYERLGQKAKAKADFERVYAADPSFEDVKQRLAALSSAATP
jgi:tetratricopeptide (TPR) repeat protein